MTTISTLLAYFPVKHVFEFKKRTQQLVLLIPQLFVYSSATTCTQSSFRFLHSLTFSLKQNTQTGQILVAVTALFVMIDATEASESWQMSKHRNK